MEEGDQKNRGQRERTGRGLEGDAIGVRENEQSRGQRNAQWEEKRGWVKQKRDSQIHNAV